jgi:hypothetical protein
MHFLALQFEASPYSNDHQVRPVIDGIDLLRAFADDSLGIDPPQCFRQPALGRGGKLLIGRCSCGDVGCGPVQVDVSAADRHVIWQVETERAYHFELQQYFECFERASLNTTWGVGRANCGTTGVVDRFCEAVGSGIPLRVGFYPHNSRMRYLVLLEGWEATTIRSRMG